MRSPLNSDVCCSAELKKPEVVATSACFASSPFRQRRKSGAATSPMLRMVEDHRPHGLWSSPRFAGGGGSPRSGETEGAGREADGWRRKRPEREALFSIRNAETAAKGLGLLDYWLLFHSRSSWLLYW